MKKHIITFSVLVSVLFLGACKTEKSNKKEGNSSAKESFYFGQKPPGLIPEVFAPEIIRNAHGISFSPDLDEIYFSASKKDEEASIYFSKLKGNKWTPIERVNFTNGKKKEELYPFVSLIDKRIYFTAFDSIFTDEKIWYVNRLEDSWSDARQLDSPINNDIVFYINQSKNGDLFYTSISKGKMYNAPNKNGEFPEVEEVEIEYGHHGFISPSQEYLLVYTRNKEDEKRKDFDIYVCFKEKNGTWTKPINLGDAVNTNSHEAVPSITPDGSYMFFGRSEEGEDGNIYWVSTEVIDKLKPADLSDSENPYFGQKPPGLIPEVFAPGIVSVNGRFEGTVSFSPDLKEMYFAADNDDGETSIYFSKLVDDKWTTIEKVDFTKGEKNEEFHPFVSPDGKRIYFTAMDSAFTDEKIWYVNRLEDSWSDAVLLDSPINDDLVFFPNQAKNGDLYYFNLSTFKTYYAPNKNGEFPEVQEVALESGHHAFISPSQEYLILTARNEEGGRRDNDMYVHFKEKDGTWTKPINLGNTINTTFNEKTPRISPDGKYLFFGRDERDIEPGLANIYWVSIEVIEKLRPEK
jgi:Tol biopolymer transport system component